MKYTLVKFTMAIIVALMFTGNVYAGQNVLEPKLGIVNWSDNSNQRIRNDTFNMDSSAVGSAGFMYLYRLDGGFAFGAELFGYTKDYTHSNGSTGEVDIGHIYGLAEYYFNIDGGVKPFVGIGLGSVGMKFTGAIKQETRGPSAQLKAGVEVDLTEKLAITGEAKYFTVDIDEEVGGIAGNIDSKGYGVFVGLAIKL